MITFLRKTSTSGVNCRLKHDTKPDEAIRYFSEVERLYPYSEWAKRSLIMQAFSQHKAKEYEDARASAQRYP